VKIAAFFFLICFLLCCRKESFTSSPDALIRAGTDTLRFDTVFTATGSTTQLLKLFNENTKGIRISSVALKGGGTSPFKINVNGQAGTQFTNVSIAEEDSTYIFVTVKINPTTADLPFVVRDSIEISYNGNRKIIQLEAYGRNAHFFRSRSISANETWNNDLPYVILGGLEVAAAATLTINEGCKIYMHADAPFIVNGTVQVTGKKYDSTRVVFTGDRLDEPYKNFPASWPGLFFLSGSKDNILEYAVVKNAYQAIVVQSPSVNGNPKLQLKETIIDNAYDAGIIAANSSITARNVLVSNCGKNVALVNGGDYQFTHCTVASFANNYLQHNDPVLIVSNFLDVNQPSNNLNALFRNCMFWGEGGLVKDEAVVLKNGATVFNVQFDRVLWKVEQIPANAAITNAINNQSPEFDSINVSRHFYSFRLKEASPAINKGVNTATALDLDGAARPVGLPDLGCYEKQ
jgi:hypothetical protein